MLVNILFCILSNKYIVYSFVVGDRNFFFFVKLSKKEIFWIFIGIWIGNMILGCYFVLVIIIRNYRNLFNDIMLLYV